jgi:outer membrane protein TolC
MSHFFRIVGSFLLTLILTTLVRTNAEAQRVPTVHHRGDSLPAFRPPQTPTDSMIRARLVNLALQNPQNLATGHQVRVAEYQLDYTKRTWLNLLSVSINYNDQTFEKVIPGQYQYPKYFFGLTIPIGLFFTLGPQIKGARETVEIAKDNQQDQALATRADVLSKYAQYKNYGDLILLENTIVVDQQTAFSQVEKKFKDGTATIEQYNQANKSYSDEQVKKLNLQLSQDLLKLAIERIIGNDLESVMR